MRTALHQTAARTRIRALACYVQAESAHHTSALRQTGITIAKTSVAEAASVFMCVTESQQVVQCEAQTSRGDHKLHVQDQTRQASRQSA